jgi:MtN3 and saliva related transmembrane protein
VDITRAFGIASALLLIATLLWQLHIQWRKGTAEGVSRFLFVGQLGASSGFAIYSWGIGDEVFLATNVATGLAAVAGAVLTLALRRRARPAAIDGEVPRAWRAPPSRTSGAASSHADQGAGRACACGCGAHAACTR